LPGEVPSLAKRLEAAGKRLAQKEWTEAIDEYQHIVEEAGDSLVPLDPKDPRHCVPARRLCQRSLASLPAAALRLYRTRVDGPAKKWLEQGRDGRDATLLQRLVNEAFCSRYTDQALDLLGDLACERGDFDE